MWLITCTSIYQLQMLILRTELERCPHSRWFNWFSWRVRIHRRTHCKCFDAEISRRKQSSGCAMYYILYIRPEHCRLLAIDQRLAVWCGVVWCGWQTRRESRNVGYAQLLNVFGLYYGNRAHNYACTFERLHDGVDLTDETRYDIAATWIWIHITLCDVVYR